MILYIFIIQTPHLPVFYDFNLSVTRCEDGVYGFFFITLSLISSPGACDQPLMFSIRDINLTQKTSYLQAGYMNVDMYTIINAIRANRIIGGVSN